VNEIVASPSEIRTKKQRLFPLHMTSFEHYMFVDDRPSYPMTFVVQLKFNGELDRAAFSDALAAAIQRHPLLTAIVGPGKGGKDCWIPAPHPQPLLSWGSLTCPIHFPEGEFIDLLFWLFIFLCFLFAIF